MKFAEEVYQKAFADVMDKEKADFGRLCVLVDALVRPTVTAWCMTTPILAGRCCEDDIIQEIHLRVIKYSVGDFFFRGDTPNRDSTQFRMWLFTVAKRAKISYIRKIAKDQTSDLEPIAEIIPADDKPFEEADREDFSLALTKAVSAVISLRVGVHKQLAWLAVNFILLNQDIKRSAATELVVRNFGDKTLDELLQFCLYQISCHPYIKISPEDKDRLISLLNQTKGGVRVGDAVFRDFFTSKGENYSISDWICKINTTIRRSL